MIRAVDMGVRERASPRVAVYRKCIFAVFLLLPAVCLGGDGGYPRILGIAIGIPAYYDQPRLQRSLSRADVLVLGFWPAWKRERYGADAIARTVRAIRGHHPGILIGQYTILNEARGSESENRTDIDIAQKLDREGWWLVDADGRRQRHTSRYDAWDINSTAHTKADSDGRRFPQWLAQRNARVYFAAEVFDFWFLDNSLPWSPVGRADWNGDGRDEGAREPATASAYRAGHASYWEAIRELQPGARLIANAQDLSFPEYREKLDGALLEAAMGRNWSLHERAGWEATRHRYYAFFDETRSPAVVGFNVWGRKDDYRQMRLGLATTLLNDGYFSYTDAEVGYADIPWFDEYDVDLGSPMEPPPVAPAQNGVYMRKFQRGLVLVNPQSSRRSVSIAPGYQRIRGRQDPEVNDGLAVRELTLPGEDGLILLKAGLD